MGTSINGEDYEKLLTNNEVQKIYGKPLPFFTYKEIADMKNIDELFPYNTRCSLILYETKPNCGHWNGCVRLNDKEIAVFDSYGKKIDESLYYVEPMYREMFRQNEKHLSELLRKSKYKRIHYNDTRLQGRNVNIDGVDYQISTCGRWCGLYFRMVDKLDMDPDEFVDFIKDCKKSMNEDSDGVVVRLTNALL